VGAGLTAAGVGEYASGHYNMRHGGHTGLKNLGGEDVATHREYVKSPNDPHWASHNLNLGRAEGKVLEEKRIIRHLTRGVAVSNAARLAGYGTAATGALMVARGNRRRDKIKKAGENEDLSPNVLQGAGGTAAVSGLGLRQLYSRKARQEAARAAAADRLHAKTQTMTRLAPHVAQRRYGFHEARAAQARHYEDVFRTSAKTGGVIAGAGGALLAAGAYGQHMRAAGQRDRRVAKSAFGVDHGAVAKGFKDTAAVALSPPFLPVEALVAPKGNKARSIAETQVAGWPGRLAGAALGAKKAGAKGAFIGGTLGGNLAGAVGYAHAQRRFKKLKQKAAH
jgi:hypothetical protein